MITVSQKQSVENEFKAFLKEEELWDHQLKDTKEVVLAKSARSEVLKRPLHLMTVYSRIFQKIGLAKFRRKNTKRREGSL